MLELFRLASLFFNHIWDDDRYGVWTYDYLNNNNDDNNK